MLALLVALQLLLLAPRPLPGVDGAAVLCGSRHWVQDRRLRRRYTGRHRRCRQGRLSSGSAVLVVGPSSARLIPPAFAAAHHRSRYHCCGWQRGWRNRPWPFAHIGALRQRAALGHHLGASQISGAQDMLVAANRTAAGKVVPADCRHGSGLTLIAIDVANVGGVHPIVNDDVLIHLGDVARADPVMRTEGLARCQRKPAQAGSRQATRAN